jgi:hypothetical protein
MLEARTFSRVHAIDSPALTTKCLCRRHNSALSPLDAEAGRLFRAVQSIEMSFSAASFSQRLHFFAGFDLERWLAKTLVSLFRAKVTNIRPETHTLPGHLADLFASVLPPPFGLYVPVPRAGAVPVAMQVRPQAALGLLTRDSLVTGISVSLGGLELRLVVAGTDADVSAFAKDHEHRPKFLNFHDGNEVASIAFAWPNGAGREIWLSRGDANVAVPSGHPERR